MKDIFFDDFSTKIEVDYNIKDINNTTIGQAVESALLFGESVEDHLPGYLIDKYKTGKRIVVFKSREEADEFLIRE